MNGALIACMNMIHQQQRRNQQAAYERRRREDERRRRRREAAKVNNARADLTQTPKNAHTEKMYMDALNAMRPYKDNLYVEAQELYDQMKKETNK